jgi:hypothetical protein
MYNYVLYYSGCSFYRWSASGFGIVGPFSLESYEKEMMNKTLRDRMDATNLDAPLARGGDAAGAFTGAAAPVGTEEGESTMLGAVDVVGEALGGGPLVGGLCGVATGVRDALTENVYSKEVSKLPVVRTNGIHMFCVVCACTRGMYSVKPRREYCCCSALNPRSWK